MAAYKPGVCNIGTVSRTSRFLVGIILVLVAVIAFFWMKNAGLSPWFRLLLFFPLYGGFLGIAEATASFCVLNAREGIFDLR